MASEILLQPPPESLRPVPGVAKVLCSELLRQGHGKGQRGMVSKIIVNCFGYGFRYDSYVNTNSDMILVWALSSFHFFGLFLFQAVFRLNFQHASMETSKKITKSCYVCFGPTHVRNLSTSI